MDSVCFKIYVNYNGRRPTDISQARWNAMLLQVDGALVSAFPQLLEDLQFAILFCI